MKKIPNCFLAIVGATLLTSAAYAGTAEVDFGFAEGGNFYCIVTGDPNVIVNIDTHNINLYGACSGPYVTRPGHLQMPASVVNTYYFRANQPDPRTGNITIDAHTDGVSCGWGTAGRPMFAGTGGSC